MGAACRNRSSALQGRVHDPGRWTRDGSSSLPALSKDGFSASHALLGGRWTDNGGRFLKNGVSIFLVSSRSALIRDLVPRYPHPAERNWHREAILACASRLAKAKPSLAAGCSSCQKWSLSLFFAPCGINEVLL